MNRKWEAFGGALGITTMKHPTRFAAAMTQPWHVPPPQQRTHGNTRRRRNGNHGTCCTPHAVSTATRPATSV